MRNATPYRAGASVREAFAGIDPEQPRIGFYRMRLRSGGAPAGIAIVYGPPLDPLTGEEMDRGWRFQCFVNGTYADDFDRYWPACAREEISADEYRHLCSVQRWAEQHAPGSGLDDPRRKIDPLSSPLVF